MRLNLPVVDEEFPFPKGENLVSTTDLKGRITYCNKAFALVSGFDSSPGASKPDPILVVDNIVRQFGGMTAVDVQHLEVQRGVITALIGQLSMTPPSTRSRPR